MSCAATAEAGNKSPCMADVAETESGHSHFVQDGAAAQVHKLLDLVSYDQREELDVEVLPEAVSSEGCSQLFAASHDVMDGRKTQKLRQNMKYFRWKICKRHAESNHCIILLWEQDVSNIFHLAGQLTNHISRHTETKSFYSVCIQGCSGENTG